MPRISLDLASLAVESFEPLAPSEDTLHGGSNTCPGESCEVICDHETDNESICIISCRLFPCE